MANFGDESIYLLSFIITILIFLIFSFTKINTKIKKHQNIISYSFAAMQFCAFYASIINNLFINLDWQKSLLQDLCPAVQFLSIIVFITHNQKGHKMLMPWLIIGSTVTMLGGTIPVFTQPIQLISYFRHLLMLIQGFLAYIWVNKYSNQEKWSILIFPSLLIIYLLFTGLIPWLVTNDSHWVVYSTALFEPAIAPRTQYEILGELNVPYPISTLLFYLVACLGAWIIVESKVFIPFLNQKIKNKYNQIIKK